jgi:hypothetical protein
MKTKLLKLIVVGGLLTWSISALTYSGGPPDSYTNAPGESNCTSCHGGSSLNGGGAFNNITLTTSTALTALQPNTTYTFNLGFSQSGRTTYGFQLCVLPASATSSSASIGTLIASSSETQLSSSTSPNRTYLMHDVSGTSASGSIKTWQFQYTTPNTINVSPVFYVSINAANGDNSSSGDLIYARTFAATVLPVKWGNIEAFLNNRGVNVKWTTLTEINNNYFEIQRSLNGYDWETIGELKGGGNQSVAKTYQYIDDTELTHAYYRVKQIDYDGKEDYSKVVRIDKTIQETIVPLYDMVSKSIVLPNLDYTALMLTDLKGNPLKVNTKVANGALQIDAHYLPAGVYILSVSNQTNNANWKVWIEGSGNK